MILQMKTVGECINHRWRELNLKPYFDISYLLFELATLLKLLKQTLGEDSIAKN